MSNQNPNMPLPKINHETYGRSLVIVESDTITSSILDLKPHFFLEGKDAFKKSIESIDLLLIKYGNKNAHL